MIKKILTSVIFIFIFFSLFAQSWGSNVLGQKVSEQTDGCEYILSEEEGKLNLYRDGSLISTTFETTDSNVRIETKEDFENCLVEKKIYTDGLLTRITETYEEKVCDYVFVYRELNLLYTSYLENSETIWVEYYLRNAADNSLMGVNRYSTTSLYGSSYILTDNKLYVNATPSMLLDSEFTVTEEGNILYVKDGITYTYSPYGLLLSEDDGQAQTSYSYNENSVMVQKTVVSGNSRIIYNYEDNCLVTQEEYLNEEIVCITFYNIDNYVMKKRVYSDGKPLADVWYGEDRSKAEKIEYLDR